MTTPKDLREIAICSSPPSYTTVEVLCELLGRVEKLEKKFEDEAGMLEYVLQKRLILDKDGNLRWFQEKSS